jgi:hypothetical protein
MWPSLFWDVTQRMLLIVYRRFGTNYLSYSCLILEDGIDRVYQNVGK